MSESPREQSELPTSMHPMVVSYVGIRRAVGFSGLLLPVVLGPGGWLLGVPFQDNISSYYHTPMRDVFVGTLCAIGVFLFCYRGHDWAEDWTANFGCISALGVAFCPLDAGADPLLQRSVTGWLHTLSGGVFFLTLAFYSIVHFPRSRFRLLPMPLFGGEDDAPPADPVEARRDRQRDLIYRGSGVVILMSLLAMGGYLLLLPTRYVRICDRWNALFWLEWTALWAFAAAWLTKGRVIGSGIAVDLMAFAEDQVVRRLGDGL